MRQIVIAIDCLREQQQRQHQENDAREKAKARREKGTVFGILAYTVITAIIAVVGGYQAHVFKETERRQLRAYVSLGDLGVRCCRPTNSPPTTPPDQLSVILENDGQTPAYFLTATMAHFEYTRNEPFSDDFSCTGAPSLHEKERYGGIINPKRGFSANFDINKDVRQQINDARDGKDWLIFCGTAIYKDIFGDAWSHRFCYEYKAPSAMSDVVFCTVWNGESQISGATSKRRQEVPYRAPILFPEVPHFKL